MEQKDKYVNEIKAIKQMMEQSSRFLSLSGLSGVLIGLYALVGSLLAYKMLKSEISINDLVSQLAGLAIVVLLISIVTVVILTYRKTISDGYKIWNKGTQLLIINLAVPLVSGGILTIIFLTNGYYGTIAPTLLIFYGLALVNAAKYTRQEIYYMGLCQVVIGILAALLPGQAILFWALGFGIIHVLYGTVMHLRYDSKSKAGTS